MRNEIPEMDGSCNSWIAVCRETGKPVLETWKPEVARAINQDKYEVLTALQHLQRINRKLREEKGA